MPKTPLGELTALLLTPYLYLYLRCPLPRGWRGREGEGKVTGREWERRWGRDLAHPKFWRGAPYAQLPRHDETCCATRTKLITADRPD